MPLDQIGELLRDSDEASDEALDEAWGGLDVLVIAVSIVSFEKTLLSLAPILAQRTQDLLIVDVLSVKEHPREVLIKTTPPNVDILATHPMFGPESGKHGWEGLPFVYDPVRISSSPHRRDVLERYVEEREREGGRERGREREIERETFGNPNPNFRRNPKSATSAQSSTLYPLPSGP